MVIMPVRLPFVRMRVHIVESEGAKSVLDDRKSKAPISRS